jgi:hypothetical protein
MHYNELMLKRSLRSWPSGRGSYAQRATTGWLIANRSWHQSWRRRGQPRRIGSVARPFNTPEHIPLYALARTELAQLIWGTTSRACRRSSEHGGSGTSPPRHPANCRTTRTQTTTTGMPWRTCQLSPARRHLLGNQPAQTKSNVS